PGDGLDKELPGHLLGVLGDHEPKLGELRHGHDDLRELGVLPVAVLDHRGHRARYRAGQEEQSHALHLPSVVEGDIARPGPELDLPPAGPPPRSRWDPHPPEERIARMEREPAGPNPDDRPATALLSDPDAVTDELDRLEFAVDGYDRLPPPPTSTREKPSGRRRCARSAGGSSSAPVSGWCSGPTRSPATTCTAGSTPFRGRRNSPLCTPRSRRSPAPPPGARSPRAPRSVRASRPAPGERAAATGPVFVGPAATRTGYQVDYPHSRPHAIGPTTQAARQRHRSERAHQDRHHHPTVRLLFSR